MSVNVPFPSYDHFISKGLVGAAVQEPRAQDNTWCEIGWTQRLYPLEVVIIRRAALPLPSAVSYTKIVSVYSSNVYSTMLIGDTKAREWGSRQGRRRVPSALLYQWNTLRSVVRSQRDRSTSSLVEGTDKDAHVSDTESIRQFASDASLYPYQFGTGTENSCTDPSLTCGLGRRALANQFIALHPTLQHARNKNSRQRPFSRRRRRQKLRRARPRQIRSLRRGRQNGCDPPLSRTTSPPPLLLLHTTTKLRRPRTDIRMGATGPRAIARRRERPLSRTRNALITAKNYAGITQPRRARHDGQQPVKYKIDRRKPDRLCRPTSNFGLEIISILRRVVRHDAQNPRRNNARHDKNSSHDKHDSTQQFTRAIGRVDFFGFILEGAQELSYTVKIMGKLPGKCKRFGRLLTAKSSEPMRVIYVNMERRRNEGAGEVGNPQENPPTNGIVRHDLHLRKSARFALVGGERANRLATVAPWVVENSNSGYIHHLIHLPQAEQVYVMLINLCLVLVNEDRTLQHDSCVVLPLQQSRTGVQSSLLRAFGDGSVACARAVMKAPDLPMWKSGISKGPGRSCLAVGVGASPPCSQIAIFVVQRAQHDIAPRAAPVAALLRGMHARSRFPSFAEAVSEMTNSLFCNLSFHPICAVQDHDGNTARLARRSDEALGVRVSVARIAPSLLDLGRAVLSGTGMKGRRKREIPEKTRRPTASTGTIPTCENPVTRSGIEPGSPWWEASRLTAQAPWPLHGGVPTFDEGKTKCVGKYHLCKISTLNIPIFTTSYTVLFPYNVRPFHVRRLLEPRYPAVELGRPRADRVEDGVDLADYPNATPYEDYSGIVRTRELPGSHRLARRTRQAVPMAHVSLQQPRVRRGRGMAGNVSGASLRGIIRGDFSTPAAATRGDLRRRGAARRCALMYDVGVDV
ncbi:hypothetical protein PR048_016929 [Dryococelus australis]|uniref:Uncharacterized protein n=1 Tax=Dryococelus australis TaxID=614101 RepID=A0ABQ9H820_9NEOP|nr:hypothetical protein PR048_016929 [Dryococelus australis]